jgi:outer membrane scaffolding protein for murein synthesis (MipA/OmpV family)
MKKLALLLAGLAIFNLSFSAVENIETGNVYLFGDGGDAKNLEARDDEEGLGLDEFDIPSNQNQNGNGNDRAQDKFQIGVSMILGSKEYEGDDAQFTFMPLFDIQYNGVYIDKTIAGIRILEREDLTFALLGEYNMMGYDANKLTGDYATALSDTENELHAGFGIEFKPVNASDIQIDFRLTRDFSSKSNGFKLHIEGERSIRYSQEIEVEPSVYYTLLSQDMINYYYGITSAQASGYDVNTYSADSAGYVIGVGLDFDYHLSPSVVLKSFNKLEMLSSEIVSSPLVQNSFNLEIGAGFVLAL